MTRDDVIQIVMSMTPPDDFVDAQIDEKLLDEFMPLFEAIAAAERNACVLACRQVANACTDSTDALSVGINHGAISCAIAIELRGGNKCAAS